MRVIGTMGAPVFAETLNAPFYNHAQELDFRYQKTYHTFKTFS